MGRLGVHAQMSIVCPAQPGISAVKERNIPGVAEMPHLAGHPVQSYTQA
jgi:hypothetical protein